MAGVANAAGYVLNYSAGTYQRKINSLNGYYDQLGKHLEQLNTYYEQMKEFWTDDAASKKFMKTIADKINEVETAMQDCWNTSAQYQKVVDDMTNAGATVDKVVEDIDASTKQAADVAGAVASIAGLIV